MKYGAQRALTVCCCGRAARAAQLQLPSELAHRRARRWTLRMTLLAALVIAGANADLVDCEDYP